MRPVYCAIALAAFVLAAPTSASAQFSIKAGGGGISLGGGSGGRSGGVARGGGQKNYSGNASRAGDGYRKPTSGRGESPSGRTPGRSGHADGGRRGRGTGVGIGLGLQALDTIDQGRRRGDGGPRRDPPRVKPARQVAEPAPQVQPKTGPKIPAIAAGKAAPNANALVQQKAQAKRLAVRGGGGGYQVGAATGGGGMDEVALNGNRGELSGKTARETGPAFRQ